MSKRKQKVVAYLDHYDTRPATVRLASEDQPAWSEHCTPLYAADPHAKLKAAVVRAAVAVFKSWPACLVAGDEERASMQAGRIGRLRRAVGALQKVKP